MPRLAIARRLASRRADCAFTLIELLVVMGLIAILGAMTALGYRTVAKDAKLSSGKNTVMAVLDNARGLAMKNNRIVMVVFRPRLDGPKNMYVEAVTAEWSGESYLSMPSGTLVADRFVPLTNVPARRLPAGIKVAGPRYGETLDYFWQVQTQLTAIEQNNPTGGNSERPGGMLGVMYGPNGTVLSRNSQSSADMVYVDFDQNRRQRKRDNANSFTDFTCVGASGANYPPAFPNPPYFDQYFEDDEPYVDIAPFLCVYDDDKARELRANTWTTQANLEADLTGPEGYINKNADRIHFNRYTGVAMK